MHVGASSMTSILPRVVPVWMFPPRQWSPVGTAIEDSTEGAIVIVAVIR